MSLLGLPDEILVQILSYKVLKRRDLCRISLVSRRLFSLATPNIYYEVDFYIWKFPKPVRPENFLRTLDESPERAELVRILNLPWQANVNKGPPYVFSILRRLPMLHTLT